MHINIKRNRKDRLMSLSQEKYIDDLLTRYKMSDCRPTSTPFLYRDLSKPPDKIEIKELNEKEHNEYRSIVGALLYLSLITRVDITYVVNVLARYTSRT